MRLLFSVLLVIVVITGCRHSDLDNPIILNKILAQAIGEDIDEREHKGEVLFYKSGAKVPLTGWKKTMHNNGNVSVLTQCRDGKVDGLEITWYENGQKQSETNFKNGKENGLVTYWHEIGNKIGEVEFKDGKEDGLETYWYGNGIMSGKAEWKNGLPHGNIFRWHENGLQMLHGYFKQGNAHGRSISWYENGQKEGEVVWDEGKLVNAIIWKPNGEQCPETNIVEGSGIAIRYNLDGTVGERSEFMNGLLHY
jgi:antitoxin component YwqK of YwqJK toxin-antitoxin module